MTFHGWTKGELTKYLHRPFATTWSRQELNAVNYYWWWVCWCDDVKKKKAEIFIIDIKIMPQEWKKCNRADQVWRQCSLFSLTTEAWCIINLFLEVKKWIKNFPWPFYSICDKQCERHDWNFGGNTAGFFTVTTLPCAWCYLSRSSSQKTKCQWFHSHPAVLISFQETFSYSQSWKLV
jgi:hypothetical protein